MLESQLEELRRATLAAFASAASAQDLEEARVEALGRKGALAQITREFGKLAPEERARLGKLLNSVKQDLEAEYERKNRWFEQALTRHPPPLVKGRRLKLRYITQAKARPPTFVVFGTRTEQLPEDYQRSLVTSLRETFDLPGTPIRLQLRGTRNPYADH